MPPDLSLHESTFGDLLRAQRLAGGLSQPELAERIGLSLRSHLPWPMRRWGAPRE